MKILKIDKDSVQVQLTKEEVETIEICFNDVIAEFGLYPETNPLDLELWEEFKKIKSQMEG